MYSLIVALASGLTQTFHLEKAYYTLGRQSSCDISLTGNKFISRVHCTLVVVEEDSQTFCLLIDGSLVTGDRSFNGTWVNGQQITSHKLSHQDVITFGQSSAFPHITFYIDSLDNGGDTIQHEKEM